MIRVHKTPKLKKTQVRCSLVSYLASAHKKSKGDTIQQSRGSMLNIKRGGRSLKFGCNNDKDVDDLIFGDDYHVHSTK